MILNGKTVRTASKDTVFQDGTLVYICPRGVKDVKTDTYVPFIGGESAMGCCPDLAKRDCAERIRKRDACPVNAHSILPSLIPARRSDLASGCNSSYMCVRLLRPPTGAGATIDLMRHTTTLPIPLSFLNVGSERGSTIMFRKTQAQIVDEALADPSHVYYDTHFVAAKRAGFYIGTVVKTKARSLAPSRTNPLVVMNKATGTLEEVLPSKAYLLSFVFADGTSSLLLDGSFVQLGCRVFYGGVPCIVVAFGKERGYAVSGKTRKDEVRKLHLVTDMEAHKTARLTSVKTDDALTSLAFSAGSTAHAHAPEDAERSLAFYNGVRVEDIDAELLFLNAGAGVAWQNVLEAKPDDTVLNDVDNPRLQTPRDMHPYLGIHKDAFPTAAEATAAFERVRKTTSDAYELRWSPGGNLQIRRRSGAAAAASSGGGAVVVGAGKPSAMQKEDVDVGLYVDRIEMKQRCQTKIKATMSLLDPDAYDKLTARCDALASGAVTNAFARVATRAVTNVEVLKSCADADRINSRACLVAAREATIEEVDEVLGDTFVEYCKMVGNDVANGGDPRCVDGATAATFFNADIQDDPIMNPSDGLLWPILFIAIVALVFAVAGTIVLKDKNKKSAINALAVLTVLFLSARVFYPYKLATAFQQLKEALRIGGDPDADGGA